MRRWLHLFLEHPCVLCGLRDLDGHAIDVQGDLAGMLALASDTKAKTAGAGVAEAVSQISLVAGGRN